MPAHADVHMLSNDHWPPSPGFLLCLEIYGRAVDQLLQCEIRSFCPSLPELPLHSSRTFNEPFGVYRWFGHLCTIIDRRPVKDVFKSLDKERRGAHRIPR